MKEKILKDKLLSIFLNDENKANKIKVYLDEFIITIKTKLNSLKLILNDFLEFFSETQKENIVLLEELIKKLSSGPINSYDKNKEKIENLINQFEEEAKIRKEKNKSSFYANIYRENKKKFNKDSEQKWIDKTENDYNKLKIIFDEEGVQALNKNDKDLFKMCLKAIKGKMNEEISNEIDTLIKLFEIDVSQNQKDKIISSLIMLSKKDDIIDIARAFSIFISKADFSKKKMNCGI